MNNEQREKTLSSNISSLSNCLLKLKMFLYTFIYFFGPMLSIYRLVAARYRHPLREFTFTFLYRPSLFSSYNQYQKCWDTPPREKNQPFLLQIAASHTSVGYNTHLPHPLLSKFSTQFWGWSCIASNVGQGKIDRKHKITGTQFKSNKVQCLKYFCNWL